MKARDDDPALAPYEAEARRTAVVDLAQSVRKHREQRQVVSLL